MLRIIDGKRYDTKTAEKIAFVGQDNYSRSDFKYEETSLYRTRKGAWFLAGHGGPMSRWARSVGNMTTGGEGIEVIDAEDARALLEQFNEPEAIEKYFAAEIEDA